MKSVKVSKLFDGKQWQNAAKAWLDDEMKLVNYELIAAQDLTQVERKQVLVPYFVNAHCHTELSYLEDKIPEHTGLVDFVSGVIRNRNTPDIANAEVQTQTAISNMQHDGIAWVGDISNSTESVAAKKHATDIHFHNFVEVAGFIPTKAQQYFKQGAKIVRTFQQNGLQASVTPHAPYSTSPQLMQLIAAANVGGIISIHNQETGDEALFLEDITGKFIDFYENELGINLSFFKAPCIRPYMANWLPYFKNCKTILAIHNTFTTEADIEFQQAFCKENNIDFYYGLCPNANLYIENKLPPIDLLIKHNCTIVLGTDSLASNHQLSIEAEMKTIKKYFPEVDNNKLWQWATTNGFDLFNEPMRWRLLNDNDSISIE